ncbi:protein phosphatase 1 regulatory subunit 36 isoform X3 [Hemicordylus capensis]|uniref:protein phosphatase 1 regulatory subunit 36 isoform X3 n=1 Tax=Hemicordylus capensis TaxID=884348 RepID=UPI0023031AFF|nr:protein phosphatase 1 regulatory subunit 36 isoform X3 [Hemicordylus capensis]
MSQLQFLELPKGAVLPITKINPGLWYWKDDTKTLEFASAYPKEEPKEKFKKGKTIHFQESGSKTLDRSTPSYFRDIFALRNSIRGAEDKSPRPVKRGQNELITLDDVKFAALFLADEDETFHVPSFSIVMRCKQLDGFLMALLYYISFFLEKIALENKPKSFMGKPSVLEKKEMKENRIKLAVTKKHLAEMYCILILGLGMAEQHHMACGKRKISTSQKDRDFFECLYNFSSYVAFVTFKQKNLKEIQQEVGRLLRSNIFNPALRDRTTRKEVIKTDITKEAKKVKFPYCRIGIIGTPRSKYNPHTLIPLGIQDEMEEDNESLRTKTSMSSICSRELTASSQRGTQDSGSHTCVAVSRATTEGDYVENPQ